MGSQDTLAKTSLQSMKGHVLIAIAIVWVLGLVSIVLYVDRVGCGIGFGLPFPANAQNIAGFVVTMTVLLGWLPTLAVGVFRVVSQFGKRRRV